MTLISKLKIAYHAVNLIWMWLFLAIPAGAVMSGLAYIFFDVINRYQNTECLLKICGSSYFIALLIIFPLCVKTYHESLQLRYARRT